MRRATVWDMVGASVAILLAALTAQVASNIIRGPGSPIDLWSILSAIATAAATIVALRVALASDREKAREEAIRARLAAAQLAPVLLTAAAKLSAACAILRHPRRGRSPENVTRVCAIFSQVVSLRPPLEELRYLASLPDDCADRISAGFAQADLMHRIIADDLQACDQGRITMDTLEQKVGPYIGMTQGIVDTLESAKLACNNAAKIKIGGPQVK